LYEIDWNTSIDNAEIMLTLWPAKAYGKL